MTTTEELIAQQIEREFGKVRDDAIVKALREEHSSAILKAIRRGDVSQAERDQAIGYLHGIASAIIIVQQTTQRVLREDE